MSRFDPSKPIDDPTVWYPKDLFFTKSTRTTVTAFDAGEDTGKTFLLDDENMVALSRFLWTGKLLPTNRDTYTNILGLTDLSAMNDKIWNEVDILLGDYTEISKGCTKFQDETWNGLVILSGAIKTYAAMAGGSTDSSYYSGMLEWIGEYNDELGNETPDQKNLDELSKSIMGLIKSEETKIDDIQAKIKDALEALNLFHTDCKGYESSLEGRAKSLESLLEEEGNDIKHLDEKIAEEQKKIQDLQVEVDRDHEKIKDTAYYVWIPFVGTIAGITVDVLAEQDLKRLEASMKEIRKLLDDNKLARDTAIRLQGDIKTIGNQVTDLISVIQPTIKTLELL